MIKNIVSMILAFSVAIAFAGCSQAMLNSVPFGYISAEEHMDQDGFQDYTDYCKYTYSSVDKFKENSKYQCVTSDQISEIKGYFKNFKSWMAAGGRSREYDFDHNCINEGDYWRIETKGEKYDNYTLWYFDTESLTLYYIHTNI